MDAASILPAGELVSSGSADELLKLQRVGMGGRKRGASPGRRGHTRGWVASGSGLRHPIREQLSFAFAALGWDGSRY